MSGRTAFVLGGGGLLGAAEVGMLRALLDAGIEPDLIVGTSIGAVNGALLADDPTPRGVQRLEAIWVHAVSDGPLSGSLRSRVSAIASSIARPSRPRRSRRNRRRSALTSLPTSTRDWRFSALHAARSNFSLTTASKSARLTSTTPLCSAS